MAADILTIFKRHVHRDAGDFRQVKLTSVPGQSLQSYKQNCNHYDFIDRGKYLFFPVK